MNLPYFIAKRYLFAKKSHNVINIISAISAIGMAVGTAALVIILSVYNGFDDLVKKSVNDINPDVRILPARGKVFSEADGRLDFIYEDPLVRNAEGVLEEEVFISYEDKQGLARAKGVGDLFGNSGKMGSHIVRGDFLLRKGDLKYCAVGSTLAYQMDINPNFVAPLKIYYPERGKDISITNPTASLHDVNVHPSCTFSISADIDESLIILPVEVMRELLGYEEEISSLEINLADGCTQREIKKFIKAVEHRLGPDFTVQDRYMQNEALYKMMRYEKISIFLILIFILIIIAFNIFGSLSMLIIEKNDDIGTLRSLGATDKLIRRIFVLEGWLISAAGLITGLVAGVAIALVQQKFGIVKLPGNYLVPAYPVLIQVSDLLAAGIAVSIIGYVTALIPVRSALR